MSAPAPIASGAWAADNAALSAALFAIDPVGLGGVVLRSGAGPVRDVWMTTMTSLLPAGSRMGRLPAGVGDDRLLGGLDLSASLVSGSPVIQRGVLASNDSGVVALAMAERLEGSVASRIAAVLDAQEVVIERDGLTARLPARLGLVLLDEGAEPEERPPATLLDRLAFYVDLHGVHPRSPVAAVPDTHAMDAARGRLGRVAPTPDVILQALCAAAADLGLDSIRPSLLAVRAARAHAALAGRENVTDADAAAAVRLVLVPRALALPAAATAEAEGDQGDKAPNQDDSAPETVDGPARPPALDEAQPSPDSEEGAPSAAASSDQLVAAAQAVLPDRLLERIVADNQRSARTPRRSGSGEAGKSARRGRPLSARPGTLHPGDRLNLPETLRAAAPWQRIRARKAVAGEMRIRLRIEDFRIRRFVQQRESTTIFLVDVSGSAAFQRLAEAKGAVELLLAKAYVSRDHVALISFRATGAEVLLAPTRSLARAKRSLADLPGGGGTPLATGLDAALKLALAERARDRTPLLVILTDGRANIGRDGAAGRPAAERDALAASVSIGRARIGAAFLDTSPRPQPGGDRFARAMGAVYAPLPYAEAGRVSALVADLRGRN